MSPGYDANARQRWVVEPPKRPGRTEFERDRARVLHSASFRRLAGKTQVVAAGEDDFPRTRLTHSLEVAQIGRELGRSIGCDPDLVELACLAHDIGHPPFGHNGEQALDEVAVGCGGFEGNAQTFRILTRLEAKAFAPSTDPDAPDTGRSVGLNLTRAGLDAVSKYPWTPEHAPKYGVYPEDLAAFTWMRAGAPALRRCLEAQVMDWSDDIAYCVHDVEDAVQAGHLVPERLDDPDHRAEVVKVAIERYLGPGDGTPAQAQLHEALAGLQSQPWWPARFDGSQRALAALKNAASELIGRLAGAAHDATADSFGTGPLARYQADLVVPGWARREAALLKAVAAVFVMGRDSVQLAYTRQRTLVAELAAAVAAGAPHTLGPELAPLFTSATDDPGRRRVVVDRVAGLTDSSAVQLHQRLCR